MEKGLCMKAVMLVPFIFGRSCSGENQWMALTMNERKGIILFLILQANMAFLTSSVGERLHGLYNYHNGKTALFYCIFLGPFRLHVCMDPMGRQITLPFLVFVFELGHWHILGEIVVQQVCSLRLFISHQNILVGWPHFLFFWTHSFGFWGFFLFYCDLPLGIWQKRNS